VKDALALCARSDPKYGDRIAPRAHDQALHRPCADCGADLLVAPTTIAMESQPGVNLVLKCNPCGNADVAQRGAKALGIAPGALAGGTPDERRRRSELEAHGFRTITPDDL
jgi:hypothetical protein